MSEVADVIARAQALVFDFDGTLVDSNPIKWRAFERCFAGFPDQLAEIMVYCRGYNHAPRWEKFRHVYENILRCAYTPEIEAALLRRFAEETTRQIIEAPEIPGVTGFLARVSCNYTTALLSSTPHETLRHILERRGWRGYFDVIQGAPVDKAAWLTRFRAERGFQGDAVVFFGDALEDAIAAQAAGCAFVAVGDGATTPDGGPCLADFTRLSIRNPSS
jgi:phosphoglycolate phosphatase